MPKPWAVALGALGSPGWASIQREVTARKLMDLAHEHVAGRTGPLGNPGAVFRKGRGGYC